MEEISRWNVVVRPVIIYSAVWMAGNHPSAIPVRIIVAPVSTGKVRKNKRKKYKNTLTFLDSGAKIVRPHRRGLSWCALHPPLERDYTFKVGEKEMKAVIVTGGKQYTVSEGDILFIEKLNAEAESTVKFDQVLAVLDGENSKIGAPVVEGASVEAKVVKNGKAKKITVFRYKAKKNEKKKQGHRQPYTKVEITKIAL